VNGKDIVELRTTSRKLQAAVRPKLIGCDAGSHQPGFAFDFEKEGIPKPTGQPYHAELLVGQQTAATARELVEVCRGLGPEHHGDLGRPQQPEPIDQVQDA
jgi:hypothetical protein